MSDNRKTSLFTKIRRTIVFLLFLAVIANGVLLYRIYKVHGVHGILHPESNPGIEQSTTPTVEDAPPARVESEPVPVPEDA
ncbi:MAG: hypothetical protein ACI8UO_005466 [Verrucomicrobiales bacterium]|jgi:hypothetical protein